ncbi:MAG: BtrH N-terminal domain-containing protein [Anaerolineae bacterium]|nr:BtrH N-terminal domain-containing protein [Anaerolineae bacterium]
MPKLENYRHFDGRHWETGTVRNFYAYRGVTAPHTGAPYTEAMLLGISGGVVMGYFSFAYEGYDPQARMLTRNTFDPLDTLLERLGVVQNILHTSSPDTGVRNLCDTLESGLPAIVWADFFSLPYNALPDSTGMWAMFPIIVYGYDEATGTAWIADRARVPITVTTGALDAARARVKKVKFRVLTLEPPNPDKLAAAVQKGIWDCIKLFTEAPPKGSKNNFGLAAFRWWADLLTQPKQRLSWGEGFPRRREDVRRPDLGVHGHPTVRQGGGRQRRARPVRRLPGRGRRRARPARAPRGGAPVPRERAGVGRAGDRAPAG